MSSTEKTLTYRRNHTNYIASISDERFLENLVFYWGQKQERTHIWFSLFTESGKKTQVVHEMQNTWSNSDSTLEWHLIKNDSYGKAIAIKKIGEGYSIDVKMPKNYPDYQLRLCTAKADLSVVTRTTLNTPLIP